MPRATSLAADMKAKYGVEPELTRRDGGYYEIYANGTQLFSKKTLGRFPDDSQEVFALIDGAA